MQDSLVLSLLKITIDTLALICCFFLRATVVIAWTIYQEVTGGLSVPVNMAARKSFNINCLGPIMSLSLVSFDGRGLFEEDRDNSSSLLSSCEEVRARQFALPYVQ
jgi:hypothetical protein